MRSLFLLILSVWLSACSQFPNKKTEKTAVTFYDSLIYSSKTQQPIAFDDMMSQLKDADVVFIGEYHGHQASHLLQAKIQAALYSIKAQQILSMEQFERDHQTDIDDYLFGETGEKTFIKNSQAWSNYAGSYRPLIEFAKQHDLPVIAANAPGDIVRCVGRQGQSYLEKLDMDEKLTIAKQPFLTDPAYAEKFKQFQQKAKHGKINQNSYYAQLLRDNTMAESIFKAHLAHPNAQILHTNGAFHSNEFLGTVAMLKQRKPDLKIAVISPIFQENLTDKLNGEAFKQGNFVYTLSPLPNEYVDASKRLQAMKAMFENSERKQCK